MIKEDRNKLLIIGYIVYSNGLYIKSIGLNSDGLCGLCGGAIDDNRFFNRLHRFSHFGLFVVILARRDHCLFGSGLLDSHIGVIFDLMKE